MRFLLILLLLPFVDLLVRVLGGWLFVGTTLILLNMVLGAARLLIGR